MAYSNGAVPQTFKNDDGFSRLEGQVRETFTNNSGMGGVEEYTPEQKTTRSNAQGDPTTNANQSQVNVGGTPLFNGIVGREG